MRQDRGNVALPVIEAFARAQGYTLDEDQEGSHGNTNYVAFGHKGPRAVVFKYYSEPERRERELYALRHWSRTGVVPEVLDDDGDRLIVQSRITVVPEANGIAPDPEIIGQTLGVATAELFSVPLRAGQKEEFESSFYGGQTLECYIEEITEASIKIQQSIPYYSEEVFSDSLDLLTSHIPFLLAPPHRLYHQDALNVGLQSSRFSGFFDLEMCRVGTLPIQIGCLWAIFQQHHCWNAFVRGYASATGVQLGDKEREGARAFAHFMVWRYVSDYGQWRGDAREGIKQGVIEAEAQGYRRQIEEIRDTPV